MAALRKELSDQGGELAALQASASEAADQIRSLTAQLATMTEAKERAERECIRVRQEAEEERERMRAAFEEQKALLLAEKQKELDAALKEADRLRTSMELLQTSQKQVSAPSALAATLSLSLHPLFSLLSPTVSPFCLRSSSLQLDAVVKDALDGKLISHDQQLNARYILNLERLKKSAGVAPPNTSLTWRSSAELSTLQLAPPSTPQTLRASPPSAPNFSNPVVGAPFQRPTRGRARGQHA